MPRSLAPLPTLLPTLALSLALVLTGCPGKDLRPTVDPKEIKLVAEAFHKRVRWKDFEGAAKLLVPERRAPFVAAREQANDERDLTISDYELLDLRIDPSALRAEVVSRLHWLRLPSLSERTDTVTTELVLLDGVWLVARLNKGPFEELKDPYDAGPATP